MKKAFILFLVLGTASALQAQMAPAQLLDNLVVSFENEAYEEVVRSANQLVLKTSDKERIASSYWYKGQSCLELARLQPNAGQDWRDEAITAFKKGLSQQPSKNLRKQLITSLNAALDYYYKEGAKAYSEDNFGYALPCWKNTSPIMSVSTPHRSTLSLTSLQAVRQRKLANQPKPLTDWSRL